jgi:DNA-binding transcriptional MerR regulator
MLHRYRTIESSDIGDKKMDYKEKFQHEGLFQIGDVAKCCGIDRQTILFYERKGLLTPTEQNESSGYRYYSTETVTELMQILQLRDSGLSLREIRDVIENGADAARRVIASMEEKLTALLVGLEQTRALSVPKGDYSISWTNLPATRCFVRGCICHGVEEAMDKMYEVFHETLTRRLPIRTAYHIYTEYPEERGGTVNLENFPMRVCVPVAPDTNDPDCVDMTAASGVAVCHRGDYSEIGAVYDVLWKYVSENKLMPAGPIREYYLDSRLEYKNKTDRYVTRLVLPVEDHRRMR